MDIDRRQTIGVGVVLVDETGRVLLGHRMKSGESPSWCLPGGHVEANETFEYAAAREVFEETGLIGLKDVGAKVVLVDLRKSTVSLTVGLVASASRSNGVARVSEPDIFSSWKWFLPTNLPSPLFPATGALLSFLYNGSVVEGWHVYAVDPVPQAAARGG